MDAESDESSTEGATAVSYRCTACGEIALDDDDPCTECGARAFESRDDISLGELEQQMAKSNPSTTEMTSTAVAYVYGGFTTLVGMGWIAESFVAALFWMLGGLIAMPSARRIVEWPTRTDLSTNAVLALVAVAHAIAIALSIAAL